MKKRLICFLMIGAVVLGLCSCQNQQKEGSGRGGCAKVMAAASARRGISIRFIFFSG